MPTNVELTPEEEEQFEKGGGLKKRTLEDRAREVGHSTSTSKTRQMGIRLKIWSRMKMVERRSARSSQAISGP